MVVPYALSPTPQQAMFGDLGYGAVGHAVATRNQLDALSAQYDWVMHAGVCKSPHCTPFGT